MFDNNSMFLLFFFYFISFFYILCLISLLYHDPEKALITKNRYVLPHTDGVYLQHAKKNTYEPKTIYLEDGAAAHWMGVDNPDLLLVNFHGISPSASHTLKSSLLGSLQQEEGTSSQPRPRKSGAGRKLVVLGENVIMTSRTGLVNLKYTGVGMPLHSV